MSTRPQPGSAAPDRSGASRVLYVIVALAGLVCTAVIYTLSPHGIGKVLFSVESAALILSIMFGPLLRGARPRRVWAVVTLGGACLLASLAGEAVTLDVGPLDFVDLTYFAGYSLLVLWVILLSHHVGSRREKTPFLDTAAVTVGAALALWSTVLAPLGDGSTLPSDLVWAVYPTLDVVLLALVIHLAWRLGRMIPALLWLIPTLAVQLVVDTIYSVTEILAPGQAQPLVVGYLFTYFGLAMAATDRSVVELSRPPVAERVRPRSRHAPALIVFTISPTILATAIPLTGTLDTVVRAALITLLLALLFVRLSRTMTALRTAEADSHHRATHDELTGLLNRAALMEALGRLLATDAARGRWTAVLFVDCDDFKYVNDTWGHQAGDYLLRDVATRLPSLLDPEDVVARHGGDEFVILSSVRDLDEAVALAERVHRFFEIPLRILPGRTHPTTSSIGMALAAPREGTTIEGLLVRADVAMYEAKQRRRGGYVVFDDELRERTRTRAVVGDRLGAAVRDDVFGLELQPVMGGPGYRTTIGWEALARWRDPVLGEISPDVFIPLAEQLGLIADLGQTVLRRACRELARLRRVLREEDIAIFVNVSPAQLLAPDFADMVHDVLAETGLPGRCLRLEITETLLIDRGSAVAGTLYRLREEGVLICLDDFGSGYASLETLLRLPVDCVKLDKSLVSRLGVDADAPRQVGAVIELVRSLGIRTVIAEGVETPRQATTLAQLGCPMVQGWLYGRPSTTEAMLDGLSAAPPMAGRVRRTG